MIFNLTRLMMMPFGLIEELMMCLTMNLEVKMMLKQQFFNLIRLMFQIIVVSLQSEYFVLLDVS